MNCSSAPELCSEYLDQRLSAAVRNELRDHLQHCKPCERHWEAYRSVFQLVRHTPEATPPSFEMPGEPPALFVDPSIFTRRKTRWWNRRTLQAAAVLLLMASHAGVYFLGERGPDGTPSRTPDSFGPPRVTMASLSSPATERVRRRQALRDHTDATDLFLRQIENLESAGEDGVELARVNLDLLRPARMISSSDAGRLEKEIPGSGDYFARVEALRTNGLASLESSRAPLALKRLQMEIERQRLFSVLLPIQAALQAEAVGCSWRRSLGEETPLTSPQVADFFAAQTQMLCGRFPEAAEAFRNFVWQNPNHPLARVAKMMECEAWVRQRRFDRAFSMVTSDPFVLTGRKTPTDFLRNCIDGVLIRPELQIDPSALFSPTPSGRRFRIIITSPHRKPARALSHR